MNIASLSLRRTLGIGAIAVVVATWVAVAFVVFVLPFSKTRFVFVWTAAVLVTEALFWVAVAIGGITAVNRFRFWRRKPRSPSNESVEDDAGVSDPAHPPGRDTAG